LTDAERIATGEAKIANLEGWLDNHEKRQNASLEKINERLEMIEKNINSRPTWAVSIFIAFLSSLCVGLIVNGLK